MAEVINFENEQLSASVSNDSIVIDEIKKEKPILQFENEQSSSSITPSKTETTDTLVFENEQDSEGRVIPTESEISNFEKLEYGWDKETMVLGNVFRIGKAKVQDLFDSDKSFKDYILENEKKRIEELNKEHWKFQGKEANSKLVTAGSIASMILDPYYLAGYLNPVSLKAMTNPISAATLNGLLIGGDVIIDNIAKTGEVDWTNVALSSGTAAVIGGVIPIGGKVLSKYTPKLIKSEVELVKKFIDNKLAKQNNLSTNQLKKIQGVANNAEVKSASNELIKWTTNFVRPIANETKKFKVLEKALLEKRNLLIKVRKLKGRKKPKPNIPGMLPQISPGKQIINIRNEIIDAKKSMEAAKKILIDRQSKKLDKWGELVANRNTKILEALKKNETTVDWAVRGLLSATVRPLVGAGMGTVGGILFGDEETDLMYWAAAGAMAGQMQKMIQRSSKFGTNLEKGKILGLIDREMTQLTLQKVRDWTSGTSASKLNSYGGATAKISKMLFREVDSSVQEKSAIAVAEQMQRYYFRKAHNITKGFTDDEIAQAVSINRGKQLTKDTPKNVEKLASDLKNYMDEFKNLYNDSGFFSKRELDNYFPRLLNYDVIKKDETAFLKTVQGIYESLGVKGTITKGINKGKLKSEVAAINYYKGHTSSGDTVINSSVLKEIMAGKDLKNKNFIRTPVSDHIDKERVLQGPYKLVEEVLEKKGYLVNDARSILSNLVNDSVKSISFARQFGTNGELLTPLVQQIKSKYVKSGLSSERATNAAAQEIKLVSESIDAYFDRYGKALTGAAKSSASILATLGNLNMLGRVTISSLGDIIQPLQNSSSWRAILKGFRKTSLTNKAEKGLAKSLNQDIDNSIVMGLEKTAGFEGKNLMLNAGWVGKTPTQKVNNIMFKALGLQWLTGYARRFAYNTATADAFYLSKTLNKLAAKGNLGSRQGKQTIYFLENNYGIKTQQAIKIGAAKNFDDAILNDVTKKSLNQAGVIGANRDALIPQVSNRLLFTQSNNQWVRLMGQFLSWAMAKSAQTNKILMRMENGSAKTLVKTLAILPIYSGVQSLREIAKHGEIVTDFDANNERWWAEGARLSGMFGFLPELVANRFIGPGSREPWYLFPPAAQIASAPVEAGQQWWNGNTDRAIRIISERLAPFPNWRRTFARLFLSRNRNLNTSGSGTLGNEIKFSMGGIVVRKNFKKGDVVEAAAMEDINLNQQEDMNIKDLASVAAAATIATTGVTADMDKAVANDILPAKKPIVIVEKTYDKVSELEPAKKKWLLDTAEKVYLTNNNNVIPNDIILAINGGETGWGSSGFLKRGSKNLFNFQSFNDKEESIAAQNSNAKIKKFKTEEDSIKQFLDWVENKDSYSGVREEIKLYNEGEGSKERIIDAIAKTGFAEDKKWSGKIKSILNKRIDGKHKKELQKLATILFTGPQNKN